MTSQNFKAIWEKIVNTGSRWLANFGQAVLAIFLIAFAFALLQGAMSRHWIVSILVVIFFVVAIVLGVGAGSHQRHCKRQNRSRDRQNAFHECAPSYEQAPSPLVWLRALTSLGEDRGLSSYEVKRGQAVQCFSDCADMI